MEVVAMVGKETDEVAHLQRDNVELKQISDVRRAQLDSMGPLHLTQVRNKFVYHHCFRYLSPNNKLLCQQYTTASSAHDVSISPVKSMTGNNVDALLSTASDNL
jgi:hypothetical protein